MKTKKIMLILRYFGVIIFVACSNTKHTTTSTSSTEGKDSLKLFEQRLRENIQVNDSVYFYNSAEILIKKVPGEEYNYVQDGIIYSVDFNKIEKIIPPHVRFYAVEMSTQKGTNIINAMATLSTKNNVDYILNFYRQDTKTETKTVDGVKTKIYPLYPQSFILSGNAKIRYKGKLFNIEVSAFDPSQKCYLLVDYRRISGEVESTEGWQQYQFVPSFPVEELIE